MGFNCSWVAVRADKASVLRALDLTETEGEVWPGHMSLPFGGSQRPGGWYVVAVGSNLDEFGEEDVVKLSKLGPAVGCQMSEMLMVSAAWGAADGQLAWSAAHEGGQGGPPFHFSEGAPQAVEIRERLLQNDDPDVDALFDGPLDVAAAVCGFKVGEHEDAFTELQSPRVSKGAPPRAGQPPRGEKSAGFFARLFGRR